MTVAVIIRVQAYHYYVTLSPSWEPHNVISSAMGSQSGPGEGFRQHLPDLSLPRFQDMRKQDAYQYADTFKKTGQPPWLHGLYLHWRKLFQQPYQGITTDGTYYDDVTTAVSDLD